MTNKPVPIFQNEKIPIVDDIPKWIKVAKDNLVYYGCPLENIVAAEDIKSSLEKYSEQHPTLIITDINFDTNNPRDTQGLSLIKRLRDNGYKSSVVAMSSLTVNIEGKTIQVGANYFINKLDFIKKFDNFAGWHTKEQS